MSDLIKTILAIFITGVLSSVSTTQVLSVEIANMKESVSEMDKKLVKLDDRLRETQLKQAKYLAAN